MKTQRKIWNFIKGIFYFAPTLLVGIIIILYIFTNFRYSLQNTTNLPTLTNIIYEFADFIDFSMNSAPFPFNNAIITPLRNVIDWVNINLFNNGFGWSQSALNYIWVQVAWYIQARLMFILFDALLFIINFAENMLNKTYRK